MKTKRNKERKKNYNQIITDHNFKANIIVEGKFEGEKKRYNKIKTRTSESYSISLFLLLLQVPNQLLKYIQSIDIVIIQAQL